MDDPTRALGRATEKTRQTKTEIREVGEVATATAADIESAFSGVADTISGELVGALKGAVLEGEDLRDVFRGLALSVSKTVLNAALKPAQSAIGGALSGFLGGVLPFAKGGVVSGPTLFPMGGQTGLMGEAGPEAILPLRRGADGRLGVAAQGGGGPSVTVNIQTPDPEAFRRSRAQIAADLARAVARGSRTL